MMKNIRTYFIRKVQTRVKGFVLPFTLVVCVIILTIATGISIILTKELYFSKLSRLSQVAYYAADNGLMCATMVDDQYVDPVTGLGIFQYDDTPTSQTVLDGVNTQRTARGLSNLNLNSIKCATSAIFDTSISGFSVVPFTRVDSEGNLDNGKTTTFNMRMDIGNGDYRCATIVVNKTASYRQIISRGFASCSTVYAYPIERAIVSTSETSGGTSATSSPTTMQAEYTTPGSYMWTAPAGVTTVSVLAIGGGGAGGSSVRGGGGGGGGGLGYRNDVNVTPGNTYRVKVGTGGVGGTNSAGGNGEDSYFKDAATVVGMGGQGGRGGGNSNSYDGGNGGNHTGSGGNGGDGGRSFGEVSGGGGGAGGYAGVGGEGGFGGIVAGASGTGGSASGGSSSGFFGFTSAQSGGGVGIYGQGTSGTTPGTGGSGGTNGSPALTNCLSGNTGGTFGGGGAGQGDNSVASPGCNGGGGAVRIIWPGNERQFPSTRTVDE
jgi:hypothetical protein